MHRALQASWFHTHGNSKARHHLSALQREPWLAAQDQTIHNQPKEFAPALHVGYRPTLFSFVGSPSAPLPCSHWVECW